MGAAGTIAVVVDVVVGGTMNATTTTTMPDGERDGVD
jgi:hypothetical protein